MWSSRLFCAAAAATAAALVLSNLLPIARSDWEPSTRFSHANGGPLEMGHAGPAGKGEVRNSIGVKLVYITAGTFLRGAPPQELGRVGDEELTETTLADDYYLATTEVTQAQYEQVMGTNPSYFGKSSKGSGDLPVEQVSWHDAVEFCQRLSQLPAEQAAGRVYRLPSEAEWEFACRAGGQRAFCFGNQASWLTNYAWFVANGDDQTHPVGKKQPNAFGLFDMHGNVHEWCADVYGGYSPRAAAHYKNNGNSGRVYRGGSWCSSPTRCRAAWRGQQDPDHRSPFNGFRIAMNLQAQTH